MTTPKKRCRIIPDPDTSSGSSSSNSSSESEEDEPAAKKQKPGKSKNSFYKIPKKVVWSRDDVENFKTNFPAIRNLSDSIIANLTVKEMTDINFKKDKGSKIFSQTLSVNYDNLKKFPVKVPGGEDNCTGKVHDSRFLRGYVSSSQDLWLQAREKIDMNGLDPISNYDTGSIGITGKVSSKVWAEIHNPSSKDLSIRMLNSSALKSAWKSHEKHADQKDFESIQELRIAVSALEAAIHKVFPWNFSFKAIAIFLCNIDYGQSDLNTKTFRTSFVADFIDEAICTNAQHWDEQKPFLSSQNLQTRWSAAIAEKIPLLQKTQKPTDTQKKQFFGNFGSKGKAPFAGNNFPRICKNFNIGRCMHKESHPAFWDENVSLNHVCNEYLPDKKKLCTGNHPASEHK